MANREGDREALALKRIARFLNQLTPSDLEAIASGEAHIALVERSRRGRPRKEDNLDTASVLEELMRMDDRAQGLRHLEAIAPTRAGLISLSARLDVPADKRDSMSRLRERIVEATIGYRLRSRAIHPGSEN